MSAVGSTSEAGKAGTERYPRVLLVSHEAFAPRGNGGIVVWNLFEGWPAGSLAVVDYAISLPAVSRCDRYWRVSKGGILLGALGIRVDESLGAAPEPMTGEAVSAGAGGRGVGTGAGRFRSPLSARLRRPVGEAIFRLPTVFSRPLREWVAAFDPEVCVSTLGSGLMLRTVVRIAEGARIPIVPYFMDDWIETRYQGDLFGGWLRSSARHWFRECLNRAPVRLAVTRDMAREYERRYGGNFVPVEYAVRRTEDPGSGPDRGTEPVRMVYMGGFEPDRVRALRAIGEALMVLASEGLRAEFSIFAPAVELAGFESVLNLPPVMKTMAAVPYEEVQKILREADVLVHAESFDPVYRLWTRYSMSTKIPEYMMAGRCIFAYGPEEIASVRYIRETGAGVVVDTARPTALVGGLRALLADPDLRRRLGTRGRAVAIERHEAGQQRERFLRAVRLACGRGETPLERRRE